MQARTTELAVDVQQLARPEIPAPGQLLICARRLDRPLGWLPASHLSLVLAYSSAPSAWDEYEGAPTRAVPGAYGPIVVRKHPFRPRLDRTFLKVPIRDYADLLQVEAILDRVVRRVNEAHVLYEPLVGPNSNTVARTFLLELGLPPLQPAAVAPGFEHESLIIVG